MDLPSGIITFLFTDIKGSTRLREEHPEAMRTRLDSASMPSLSMPHIIFETARLTGRRLDPDDLNAMLAVYGDAEAMRYVGDGQPLCKADGIEWLDVTANNYRLRGYGMFTIVERASGTIIGFCGLVHPEGQQEAGIKYALKREYWGQGFATEAVRALLDYGTRAHGRARIIATTDPANSASHNVLLKAGMFVAKLRTEDDGAQIKVFATA